jgi:hypothetical protein
MYKCWLYSDPRAMSIAATSLDVYIYFNDQDVLLAFSVRLVSTLMWWSIIVAEIETPFDGLSVPVQPRCMSGTSRLLGYSWCQVLSFHHHGLYWNIGYFCPIYNPSCGLCIKSYAFAWFEVELQRAHGMTREGESRLTAACSRLRLPHTSNCFINLDLLQCSLVMPKDK